MNLILKLDIYKEHLIDRHLLLIEEIIKCLRRVSEETYIENSNGIHTSTCVWSSEKTQSGPDSCPCVFKSNYVKSQYEIAIDIFNTYREIFDKKQNPTSTE